LVGGKGSSKKAVYAALFGNLGIAISKLVAAILTGSTSMWAETYHSFSDVFQIPIDKPATMNPFKFFIQASVVYPGH
jgi:Co/Zn/Cd efflux system component